MSKDNKTIMVITMIVTLFFISGCTNNENEGETLDEKTETSEVYVMKDISTVKTVEIISPEEIKLEYRNNEWQTNDLDEIDQEAVNDLFNELFSILGTPVEENLVTREEPLFSFVIHDGEDTERGFTFLKGENKNYLMKDGNGDYYRIESIPSDIEYFNISTLKPTISLSVDEISTIQITQNNQPELILNQDSQMNEVEKSPFISGWFLHGPFETEFSVEYKNIQRFIDTFENLKGIEKNTEISQNTETSQHSEIMRLTIKDEEKQDILIVNEKNSNEEFYNVYIESQDAIFEIPAYLIEEFIFEPLTIVDNFIVIIPVDKVQEINIESSNHKNINITVDENNPSLFYMNGEAIEEEKFRKSYQYLAMLSYNRPISEDNLEKNLNLDDKIKITYEYGHGEEDYRTEVFMQSIQNTDEYLVTKNNVTEFTVKNVMILNLFDSLDQLIDE
jgi:hypothetical protein